ncbi:hypothetical protein D1007_60109 [Hordeum vulgare]|nr:hypothetical protein D1007_60109 [Hordeum vulgare]
MAAPPTSQVGCSQILIDDDDVAGSGCDIDVTHVTPKAKGCKKRSCPYSPSPVMVQKIAKDSEERMQFKRIADLWEKRETSRNSVTSEMKVDLVTDEIKEMKDMVVNDGGIPGSEVYFHALELFPKKEHRDVFSALKDELPSMDISVEEEQEDELDFVVVAMAYYVLNKERPPYGPRRAPIMTGLQCVEEKEKEPQIFYSMFRMRRIVTQPRATYWRH